MTLLEKKRVIKKITTKNIYLFELSDVFDNQVYLPYSSGVIWSYVRQDPYIKDNYSLKDWFFAREEASEIIDKINDPDILLFSCYMWNWIINCEIAKEIKKRYPKCIVIFGGQHQPLPDRNKGFFKQHDYVDILIHHEGEETVREILIGKNKEEIEGITYQKENKEFSNPPRVRLKSIKDKPSPYLDGSFDWIVQKNKKEKNYVFHTTVESARGCPYSCSFCECGDDYYKKVLPDHEKTKREIDWISKNKIGYVHDANNNFGLLFREDYALAEYVTHKKNTTGYPQAYRVCWAKGIADKVLEIAKIFERNKVQKGMTIALQSMNLEVLSAVKRRNVNNGKLKEFIDTYEKDGISSYVELMWGLPEETLETFIDGVSHILEQDYHNSLDIHLLVLLPNAPMSSPGYKEQFGLKTLDLQPMLGHRTNPKQLTDDVSAFVVESNSFTTNDWLKGIEFRWIIKFGHYLGPLQFISRFFVKMGLTTYKDFYLSILKYADLNPSTFIGQELKIIKDQLQLVVKNKRYWGDIIESAGDINWDMEEATCIRLLTNKDDFYSEIRDFLKQTYNLQDDLLDEVIKYQRSRLNDHFVTYPYKCQFDYNLHEFITNNEDLIQTPKEYEFFADNHPSIYEWAKNTLWFGRRIARYKTKVR